MMSEGKLSEQWFPKWGKRRWRFVINFKITLKYIYQVNIMRKQESYMSFFLDLIFFYTVLCWSLSVHLLTRCRLRSVGGIEGNTTITGRQYYLTGEQTSKLARVISCINDGIRVVIKKFWWGPRRSLNWRFQIWPQHSWVLGFERAKEFAETNHNRTVWESSFTSKYWNLAVWRLKSGKKNKANAPHSSFSPVAWSERPHGVGHVTPLRLLQNRRAATGNASCHVWDAVHLNDRSVSSAEGRARITGRFIMCVNLTD